MINIKIDIYTLQNTSFIYSISISIDPKLDAEINNLFNLLSIN